MNDKNILSFAGQSNKWNTAEDGKIYYIYLSPLLWKTGYGKMKIYVISTSLSWIPFNFVKNGK